MDAPAPWKDGAPRSAGALVVITDHIMPGLSGSEFVRELRSLHPTLPVLVISGLEEAEEEYHDLNILFRLKPLLPDNLLASVNRLVHHNANQH